MGFAAGFLLNFNAVSVHARPGRYDRSMIVVGRTFNVLTIWLSATWRTPGQ